MKSLRPIRFISWKASLVRYFVAVLVIGLAGFIEGATPFGFVAVAIVSLKLLIYDRVVAGVKAFVPSFRVMPWLPIGYLTAVLLDMVFTYGASQPGTDAGFAFLGTLVVSPWVLVGAFVAMVVSTFLARRRPSAK